MEKSSVLEIPLFHKVYELYKLLHGYYPQIPKSERYTLWQKCENTTLLLLEALIETRHHSKEQQRNSLTLMSQKLDLLKVLIRLAKDLQLLNSEQTFAIQEMLHEIGKMIGGWMKFVSH